MHKRDSNPQSQPASGRRPTPQTARPLGPALIYYRLKIDYYCYIYLGFNAWAIYVGGAGLFSVILKYNVVFRRREGTF